MVKKRLIELVPNAKKYIAIQVVFNWLGLLCQIGIVYCLSVLFMQVWQRTFEIEENNIYLMGIGMLMFVRFGMDRLAVNVSYKASLDVKSVLRHKIYSKLVSLKAGYSQYVATGQVVQMATEGVEQLETYFGRYLSQLFYSLLAPITLFIVLSFLSLKASLVLLVCVPLIPMSIIVIQKLAKRLLSKYWNQYAHLGDSFLENLQGLTTLKIYQADEVKAKEMDKESQLFRKVTMKVLMMQLNSTSVMDILAYGGAAIGILVTLLEYQAGNLSIQGAFMLVLLSSEFFIPLRLLGSFFHIAMNGMAASDKIFALLDLEEEKDGVLEIPENAEIQIRDLWFGYEEERTILSDITIELKPNSFTAIVGASGSGKSTIAGLLTGKLNPDKGGIYIQDKLLQDYSQESRMKHITLLKHNAYLFKGSVEENLRMAKPDASKEELIQVLKEVNMYDFLETQDGLKTQILEKGSNFSGGQCQRLAIARALLHDSQVYIFDEASSNIDMESEERIMEVIRHLAKTKTVLMISHRLSNVVDSDRIYFLKEGKIQEQGNHKELMALDQGYAHMYRTQMELEQFGKEDLHV